MLPIKILTSCPLIHLNVGYNQISVLDSLLLKKFVSLKTLVLRNNPIHSISYFSSEKSLLDTSFPNLNELSLSFTELSNLPPFPSLPFQILEISGGLKEGLSITAAHFSALKSLEWIAIDHNQIKSVRCGESFSSYFFFVTFLFKDYYQKSE
jgi:Leucine-rich repeat (LRR) protein